MFSSIPLMIGFACYYFLGNYVFGDLQLMGKEYLAQHMDLSGWVGSIFTGLVTVLFVVFMNFTFFIFVSIIASPFNDLISARVEKIYGTSNEEEQSLKDVLKRLPTTLKNEAKKIVFIIVLSFINLAISLTFPPASFIIAGIILAISFVDYSWSRNELSVTECIKDLKRGFVTYLLAGIAFMFLISIPIINLFFLPLAVVFFTVIFCELKVANG